MSVRIRPEAPGIAAFRGDRPTTAASRLTAAVDGALGLKPGTAMERRRLALAAEPVPWRDAGSRGPHQRQADGGAGLAVDLVRSLSGAASDVRDQAFRLRHREGHRLRAEHRRGRTGGSERSSGNSSTTRWRNSAPVWRYAHDMGTKVFFDRHACAFTAAEALSRRYRHLQSPAVVGDAGRDHRSKIKMTTVLSGDPRLPRPVPVRLLDRAGAARLRRPKASAGVS